MPHKLTRLLQRLSAYAANPDPRAAAANTLALLLASNGPTFPVYLYLAIGRGAWPSLLMLWAMPAYAAVPAVARRHPRAGRVLVALLACLTTVLYTVLFGTRAELHLFLLPCIALGLLFGGAERLLGWALGGLALVLFLVIRHAPIHPIVALTDGQYDAMRTLDEVSVATLTWFMMAMFGTMTTALARPDDARPHNRSHD